MSHKANDNFYESLTEAVEEKQITVRELFDYFDDGALTREELNKLLANALDPRKFTPVQSYDINGHPVTKERYEEYMRETNG